MFNRVRLVSGIILMLFATTHLVNHAFGLVSLDAMEAARRSPLGFWHRGPLNLILLVALIAHIVSSLISIGMRRNIRMPAWQWFQILSGILIPIWLTGHLLGTGIVQGVHGFEVNYHFVMPKLWPGLAERQILMSLLIWLHGCIGIHFWLRHRSFYCRFQPVWLAAALLIPALSMSGFVAGGKNLELITTIDDTLSVQWAKLYAWPKPSDMAWTFSAEAWIVGGFSLLLLTTAVWRIGREIVALKSNKVTVVYEEGQRVRVPPGTSILEASQIAGIPHASVCGGRGRCSTCRVRAKAVGEVGLPEASAEEAKVLARLRAIGDVRLACRLRPQGAVKITRLMAPTVSPGEALKPMDPGLGTEREIAVLFADLRDFTRLSEGRLPFDVVHLLNRYFEVMGNAIEQQGGRIDKFIGDGIMALFGIGRDPQTAAHSALRAAASMSAGLKKLNSELAGDLDVPLRMGIGLHQGHAIVGEMGFGHTVSVTAIGDTVNTASRLETACKELGCELVVSRRLVDRSQLTLSDGTPHELQIRGRQRKLAVLAWPDASTIISPEATPESQRGRRGWLSRLLRPFELPRRSNDRTL